MHSENNKAKWAGFIGLLFKEIKNDISSELYEICQFCSVF